MFRVDISKNNQKHGQYHNLLREITSVIQFEQGKDEGNYEGSLIINILYENDRVNERHDHQEYRH